MLSVGVEGIDETPKPPPSRSSLFVLVGSISRFRSSIGTTRSVDGDPDTVALRSISILFTVLATGVDGRLVALPTSTVFNVSAFRRLISERPLIGTGYVSYETRGYRNRKGGDLGLQR